MYQKELIFTASQKRDPVSAIAVIPPDARHGLVLAHGAGAGMRHTFMEALTVALAGCGVATFRYQFPYMEAGKRRPDARAILLESVASAVATARDVMQMDRLFAGGKSMGGRMTSQAVAEGLVPAVRGLVFFGFPLHPAGKPSIERAAHLADIDVPGLFLQGTRDALALNHLIEPVVGDLGARARLYIVEGADHGFHVLKKSGRTDGEVLRELAETARTWMDEQ